MKVKICGIQNEINCEKVCELKPDFIGIVFHSPSRRNVSDLSTAKKFSHIAKKQGIKTVGVFVDQSAKEIEHICAEADIDIAQLHGETAKKQHHLLPESLTRIYVIPVTTSGLLMNNPDEILHLNPERDYILFDHQHPGHGNLFDHDAFSKNLNHTFSHYQNFRCFLAGGLTPNNIETIIRENNFQHFYGLDVSTGVENDSGRKCVRKVKKFLAKGKTL